MLSILLLSLLSTVTLAVPWYRAESPVHELGFPGNTRLDYCASPKDQLVDVLSVDVKTGPQRVVTITGKAKTELNDDVISAVNFLLPFIGGPGDEFKFCKDLGVKCPVAKGDTFTATHNLTLKLWPGFSEDKYKLEILFAKFVTFPPDVLMCVNGPYKFGRSSIDAQHDCDVERPLVENKAHWEMK